MSPIFHKTRSESKRATYTEYQLIIIVIIYGVRLQQRNSPVYCFFKCDQSVRTTYLHGRKPSHFFLLLLHETQLAFHTNVVAVPSRSPLALLAMALEHHDHAVQRRRHYPLECNRGTIMIFSEVCYSALIQFCRVILSRYGRALPVVSLYRASTNCKLCEYFCLWASIDAPVLIQYVPYHRLQDAYTFPSGEGVPTH